MPRLSLRDRERVLGQLQSGRRAGDVALDFGCHISTIYRLIERERDTGTSDDRRRSGRPRVTSERQDRYIRLTHLRQRNRPATVTARETPGRNNPRISAQTVRRRLRSAGIKGRKPYVGPKLTLRHRQARLRWCRHYQNRRLLEWRNVLFSDESRFCIDHVDGRTVVWRRDGERLSDACVVEKDRFGGPNVMMWGGIAYGTRTQPVFLNFQNGGGGRGLTAQRYIDQVLRPVVVPFMAQRPGFEFQQDNARPHSARVSQDFLQANGVTVMNWPALSPDMAPIEHLWDEIGRRIKRRP